MEARERERERERERAGGRERDGRRIMATVRVKHISHMNSEREDERGSQRERESGIAKKSKVHRRRGRE
jgi:hypothetical protein